MPKPVWIVAFAGLETDVEVDELSVERQDCEERIRIVLIAFQKSAEALDGSIELFCGAAKESERLAISVAESLGLAVHVILPLPLSEFADDFRQRPGEWDNILATIGKAGGLVDHDGNSVSKLCSRGERKRRTADWPPVPRPGWTFRVSEGSHERVACHHDAVTQMLDAADAWIVLVDQTKQDDRGYRLAILEQAEARGLPSAIIDPWKKCSPQIDWKAKPWSSDTVIEDLRPIIDGRQQNVPTSSNNIECNFAALDDFANRTGGRVMNRAMTIISLQFSATIIATINSALLLPIMTSQSRRIVSQWDMTLITYQVLFACELAFVFIAFLLGLASRWSNLKSRWRQARFGAEVLRSLIQTRGLVDPLFPIVARHDPVWHRFALSSGLAAHRENPVHNFDWQSIKAVYHRDRMEHQRNAYFRKQLVGASKLSAVCGRIAAWTGALAPIGLILAIYLKWMHSDWITTSTWSPVFIKFLPILLPLLAGTSASLKVITDAGRRAERYNTQANRLERASQWFISLQTPSSIRRAVYATEEILLDELIEWHVASKNTGN
jgi:hypothetical protein